MGLVVVILLAAIVVGILSVVVKGLLWLLFLALVLVAVAFVVGRFRGGSRRAGRAGV